MTTCIPIEFDQYLIPRAKKAYVIVEMDVIECRYVLAVGSSFFVNAEIEILCFRSDLISLFWGTTHSEAIGIEHERGEIFRSITLTQN